MSSGEPVVGLRALSHWFGEGEYRRQVLFEDDLDVRAGELVALTGPSGSGKTTLLTLVGGLRRVQQGAVTVLGERLEGLSESELVRHRRRIGFVFQSHNLFPALTGLENVRMALDLADRWDRREKDRRAAAILARLGVEGRMHAKPRFMSEGQRQRVAIARALVHEPAIVLADEPTAALDKDRSRDVVDLLRSIAHDEGRAILMVTHDTRITDAADRIVRMVDGRIVEGSPPAPAGG